MEWDWSRPCWRRWRSGRRLRRDPLGPGHPALPEAAGGCDTRLQPAQPAVDSPERAARILVAGVGNMFLRDDGFGPEVARRLGRGPGPAGAAASGSWTTASAACIWPTICWPAWTSWCSWTPCRRTDGEEAAPGSIRVLRVTWRGPGRQRRPWIPTAWIRRPCWAGSARSGGELPLTYVVGCVPADLAEGIGLSPPVAAAVPEAMAAVGHLLAATRLPSNRLRRYRTCASEYPARSSSSSKGYGGQLALVDVAGVRRKINIGLLDDGPPEPGSWVLIHMGFALERVDAAGAEQAMGGLELMGRPREPESEAGPGHPLTTPHNNHSEENSMSPTNQSPSRRTGERAPPRAQRAPWAANRR